MKKKVKKKFLESILSGDVNQLKQWLEENPKVLINTQHLLMPLTETTHPCFVYCLWNFLPGAQLLLEQAVRQKVNLKEFVVDSANLLHWVAGFKSDHPSSCLKIRNEMIRLLVDSGFPLHSLDYSIPDPKTAAWLLMKDENIEGLECVLSGYTLERLSHESPVLLEESSSKFRKKIEALLARIEAKDLQREMTAVLPAVVKTRF